MAIMYVLTVTDLQGAGPFPPEIVSSDWYANLTNYANFFSLGGTVSYRWSFIFDNQDSLNNWLAEYGLDDDDLSNKLRQWTVDHRVVYSHKFYQLPEISNKGVF